MTPYAYGFIKRASERKFSKGQLLGAIYKLANGVSTAPALTPIKPLPNTPGAGTVPPGGKPMPRKPGTPTTPSTLPQVPAQPQVPSARGRMSGSTRSTILDRLRKAYSPIPATNKMAFAKASKK